MATIDAPPSEVSEDAADPKTKAIYDDITATFRVPLVSLVFRVLATQPRFLELAWRQLRPNLLTVYCERQADAIRAHAVGGITSLGGPPRPPDDAVSVLAVFHYANPKLLLAVGALRAAVGGQCPPVRLLPASEKRQIVSGVPTGVPTIELVDPDSADESVARIFRDIKVTLGTVRLSTDYRALARWPDYLGWAWQTLKPGIGHPEYRRLQRELRRMADEAILSLPFRLELSPHTLRLSGLSESDIDSVRSTLDEFYSLLSGLVINIAFFSIGRDGEFGAARSPFPVELK